MDPMDVISGDYLDELGNARAAGEEGSGVDGEGMDVYIVGEDAKLND